MSVKSKTKSIGKTILFIILGIIIIYLSQFIFGAIYGLLGTILIGKDATLELAGNRLFSLFFTFPIIIGTALVIKILTRRKIGEFFIRDKNLLQNYLKGMGLALVLLGIFLCVCLLTGDISYVGFGGMKVLMVLLFFIGFTIQAFSEEFAVRGLMQTLLEEKTNVWVSIILPSAIFSLLHLANPNFNIIAMICTFIIGLIFAYITYLTRSLWMASGLHMLWNYLIGPFLGLPVSGLGFSESAFSFVNVGDLVLMHGGSYGPEASGLMCIILVIALWVIHLNRERLKNREFFAASASGQSRLEMDLEK